MTITSEKILEARRRPVVKLLQAVWNVQKKSKKRGNNFKYSCKTQLTCTLDGHALFQIETK